jgi:hypothetical protein|tara:strand:- start:2005 stop:2352 length:348 start_codon:yes stop_codon:yes gene_type:complete
MTTNYETAAEFGRDLRKEISPLLKSKGFDIKLSTTKNSYYHGGNLNIKIKKVPKNFPVWVDEYSRWEQTENAKKLISTIKNRIEVKLQNDLDLNVEVNYDRNIPFVEYETENTDG